MSSTTPAPSEHLALGQEAQDLLFRQARTVNNFSDEPVTDEAIRAVYDLVQWAPTSANTQPLRIVIIRSAAGKERLMPHVFEGNRVKVQSAPAIAILAADHDFHENIPRLMPMRPEMKDMFADVSVRAPFANFNTGLQIGYFILGVRAAGLYAGPLAGFDAAGVDAEFFPGQPVHAQLLVNIGTPGESPWYPRLPRLDFEEVVSFV